MFLTAERRSDLEVATRQAPHLPDEPSQNGDASALWAFAHEAVAIVDRFGEVSQASPSWGAYGHAVDDLLGKPFTTVVHPDDRVMFEAYLFRPELAGVEPVIQSRVARADGSWFEAVARLRLVHPSPDAPALAVSVAPLDDAEARALGKERRAEELLRATDEMKHRLIEVTSRELRTPLTVIAGFGQTLQRPDLTLPRGRLAEIGESIERHAARLESVVADLVDLDHPAGERLLDDARLVRLGELVRDTVEQVPLGDRRVVLETEAVTVLAEEVKCRRIIECLLDNVRRHTPETSTVWVRVTATEAGALLEVADDGPGLTESVRGEAFSAFAQGDLHDPASSGLGIGLALVQQFAELHGGRCWHTARDGGGSRFMVQLPHAPPSAAADASTEPAVGTERVRPAATAPTTPELSEELRRMLESMLETVRSELAMRVAYLSVFSPSHQIVLAVSGDGHDFGIEAGVRIPIDDTYCMRMIRQEVPQLVTDTSREPELADLPATRQGLAAYAGVPLHLASGNVFGSLCCADGQPRDDLAPAQLAVLRAVARVIADELARHELAAAETRELAARVEQVLGRTDGLRTVYQPIVDLATGNVAGVEALSRFHDSDLRPPDLWFADAARVGLAGQLEQLAIIRALRGVPDLPATCYLSVNVSPTAIDAGGLRPLLGRIPLERIVIEITEHAAVSDYGRLASQLRPFRDAGARLAIDDVGAGFASLRHVLLMHPDIIKLDRSLVNEVTTDAAQRALTAAFGELAARLDATLVAEGIEDAASLDALAEAGVTHGQGWLFDRAGPLPLRQTTYEVPGWSRQRPGVRAAAGSPAEGTPWRLAAT